LKAEGMATKAAQELVATYGTSQVMRYVESLPYQKNLRNPAGWLRKAIENNYELDMPPVSSRPKQVPTDSKVEANSYQYYSFEASKERREDYAMSFSDADEGQGNRIQSEEEQEHSYSQACQDPDQEGPISEPTLDPQAIEAWEALVEDLVALRGQESLPPWFDQLQGGHLKGTTLTVLVPNSTAANHLNDHFGADLVPMWRERAGADAVLQVATNVCSDKRAVLVG